ncbi:MULTISPECIES: cytochrome P450 [unclassified Streptomyces]|uniref:cytochrome P450 n=1 Tax=unclassified Streptomyces TaxID=2593676 RepID=UPI002E2CC82A|nr:cytochrome P450 [Streptomyces sp. NBC_00223]
MSTTLAASVPTAPKRLPLLGHAVPLLRDPVGLLQSIRPLGEVVRVCMGPLDVYVLNSPALVRQMLASDSDSFRKGRFYEKFRPYQGDGLFTLDGDVHHRQRRLVAPAFHRSKLKEYTKVMRDGARARSADWTPGGRIDVGTEMYTLTSEIVARVLFGSEMPTEGIGRIREWLPEFIQGMGRKVVSPVGWFDRLPTPANRRFETARQGLRTLIDGLIASHLDGDGDERDLLTMLIEARDADTGEPLTPAQLRDEAMTFFNAGIETVSSTLTWLFYELGRNPLVEKRVLAEVEEVLGSRPVTFDDIPRLPYLQSVVRETLRLHSPAWMLTRRPAAATVLGGLHFPAGTELLCSPATLHRDPEIYPRPLEFDPDRWQTVDHRGPTFLAFSAGPYKCLGDHFALAELVIAVATITPRWHLAPVSDRAPREVAGAALAPDRVLMTTQPQGC